MGRRPAMKTKQTPGSKSPFLADIKEIRRRAREHIELGAVTAGYKANRKAVVDILNDALATELVCVLRYKRHQYMASGIHARDVAAQFAENAAEEQGHADLIAERITQLDGEPNFDPKGLATRSHTEYVPGKSLVEMIREDLVAERIAIQTYGEIIRYVGNDDPTTRLMIERINAMEEEHAEEMKTLLETVGKDRRFAEPA
jgi:bacterioferritin